MDGTPQKFEELVAPPSLILVVQMQCKVCFLIGMKDGHRYKTSLVHRIVSQLNYCTCW
ncbi:putative sulfated surface glycoprotein 185-like [Iris pallida]|uniref:Sulfated surface glycoprotein 185-like n=1 Tax=Iris pallida TaxID=29817 RepID=A0AAX6H0H6_IRIPA|nr:putative sulfated surface glycoprotein 185-like [Iris pallida]